MTADSEHSPDAVAAVSRQGSPFELVIVFGLMVGVPLLWTITATGEPDLDFGQARLLETLAVEAVMVALLWPWLVSRGWSFRRIAGPPVPRDLLRGLWVALAAYVAYYICATILAALVPGIFDRFEPITGTASVWIVLLTGLVNAVVEEFLWLAYGITALQRFGPWGAIVTSVGLRTAVHTYQGIFALIYILPLGLVFTIYYWRTRRVWPLVVAHVLHDATAMLPVMQ
jgi:membrane protease YdiL (CAAX protease family)